MFWKLGRPSQGSVSLANTILPESEPAPGFPVSPGAPGLLTPLLSSCPLGHSSFREKQNQDVLSLPYTDCILWPLAPENVLKSAVLVSSVQTWLCPDVRMSVTFIPGTFMPHHFLNEKPQNTSLVRYKIVCKANEEVINTLFFDRMRLLADGVWKVASPSLSFLAPGPDQRPNFRKAHS